MDGVVAQLCAVRSSEDPEQLSTLQRTAQGFLAQASRAPISSRTNSDVWLCAQIRAHSLSKLAAIQSGRPLLSSALSNAALDIVQRLRQADARASNIAPTHITTALCHEVSATNGLSAPYDWSKAIGELQAALSCVPCLDIDVTLSYARVLLRFSRSVDGLESSHQELCFRSIGQGIALLTAALEVYGDSTLIQQLPLLPYCQRTSLSMANVFRATHSQPLRATPAEAIQSAMVLQSVPADMRQRSLVFILLVLLGHSLWALVGRADALGALDEAAADKARRAGKQPPTARTLMSVLDVESHRLAKHLAGRGKTVPEPQPPEVQPSPADVHSSLWRLAITYLEAALAVAPEPAAAAEVVLALHDATIEYLTAAATCGRAEATQVLQAVQAQVQAQQAATGIQVSEGGPNSGTATDDKVSAALALAWTGKALDGDVSMGQHDSRQHEGADDTDLPQQLTQGAPQPRPHVQLGPAVDLDQSAIVGVCDPAAMDTSHCNGMDQAGSGVGSAAAAPPALAQLQPTDLVHEDESMVGQALDRSHALSDETSDPGSLNTSSSSIGYYSTGSHSASSSTAGSVVSRSGIAAILAGQAERQDTSIHGPVPASSPVHTPAAMTPAAVAAASLSMPPPPPPINPSWRQIAGHGSSSGAAAMPPSPPLTLHLPVLQGPLHVDTADGASAGRMAQPGIAVVQMPRHVESPLTFTPAATPAGGRAGGWMQYPADPAPAGANGVQPWPLGQAAGQSGMSMMTGSGTHGGNSNGGSLPTSVVSTPAAGAGAAAPRWGRWPGQRGVAPLVVGSQPSLQAPPLRLGQGYGAQLSPATASSACSTPWASTPGAGAGASAVNGSGPGGAPVSAVGSSVWGTGLQASVGQGCSLATQQQYGSKMDVYAAAQAMTPHASSRPQHASTAERSEVESAGQDAQPEGSTGFPNPSPQISPLPAHVASPFVGDTAADSFDPGHVSTGGSWTGPAGQASGHGPSIVASFRPYMDGHSEGSSAILPSAVFRGAAAGMAQGQRVQFTSVHVAQKDQHDPAPASPVAPSARAPVRFDAGTVQVLSPLHTASEPVEVGSASCTAAGSPAVVMSVRAGEAVGAGEATHGQALLSPPHAMLPPVARALQLEASNRRAAVSSAYHHGLAPAATEAPDAMSGHGSHLEPPSPVLDNVRSPEVSVLSTTSHTTDGGAGTDHGNTSADHHNTSSVLLDCSMISSRVSDVSAGEPLEASAEGHMSSVAGDSVAQHGLEGAVQPLQVPLAALIPSNHLALTLARNNVSRLLCIATPLGLRLQDGQLVPDPLHMVHGTAQPEPRESPSLRASPAVPGFGAAGPMDMDEALPSLAGVQESSSPAPGAAGSPAPTSFGQAAPGSGGNRKRPRSAKSSGVRLPSGAATASASAGGGAAAAAGQARRPSSDSFDDPSPQPAHIRRSRQDSDGSPGPNAFTVGLVAVDALSQQFFTAHMATGRDGGSEAYGAGASSSDLPVPVGLHPTANNGPVRPMAYTGSPGRPIATMPSASAARSPGYGRAPGASQDAAGSMAAAVASGTAHGAASGPALASDMAAGSPGRPTAFSTPRKESGERSPFSSPGRRGPGQGPAVLSAAGSSSGQGVLPHPAATSDDDSTMCGVPDAHSLAEALVAAAAAATSASEAGAPDEAAASQAAQTRGSGSFDAQRHSGRDDDSGQAPVPPPVSRTRRAPVTPARPRVVHRPQQRDDDAESEPAASAGTDMDVTPFQAQPQPQGQAQPQAQAQPNVRHARPVFSLDSDDDDSDADAEGMDDDEELTGSDGSQPVQQPVQGTGQAAAQAAPELTATAAAATSSTGSGWTGPRGGQAQHAYTKLLEGTSSLRIASPVAAAGAGAGDVASGHGARAEGAGPIMHTGSAATGASARNNSATTAAPTFTPQLVAPLPIRARQNSLDIGLGDCDAYTLGPPSVQGLLTANGGRTTPILRRTGSGYSLPGASPIPDGGNRSLGGRPTYGLNRVRWSAEVLAVEHDRRTARQASMDETMMATAGDRSALFAPPVVPQAAMSGDGMAGSGPVTGVTDTAGSGPAPSPRLSPIGLPAVRSRSPRDREGMQPRASVTSPLGLTAPSPSPIPPAAAPLDHNRAGRLPGAWPISLPSQRCWPVHPPKHSPLSPAFLHRLWYVRTMQAEHSAKASAEVGAGARSSGAAGAAGAVAADDQTVPNPLAALYWPGHVPLATDTFLEDRDLDLLQVALKRAYVGAKAELELQERLVMGSRA